MNTHKILALAALLRSQAAVDHFNMDFWINQNGNQEKGESIGKAIHTCGTTACMAGWAVIMDSPDFQINDEDFISDKARDILGLGLALSGPLFMPAAGLINYRLITNEIAAGVLEKLAATGEVHWPKRVHWG